MLNKLFRLWLAPLLLLILTSTLLAQHTANNPPSATQAATTAATPEGLRPILDYISNGWDTLTRSMNDCSTIVDTKLATKSILYVPADFTITADLHALESRCNIDVKPLPKIIHHLGEIDTTAFTPHGLLYLEHPYVVPGGRFNEMYGWDSYFIIRGLLRAGRIDLARGMVENFFFEIEHYGAVLNANRTYYLSRSQPPFLTSMILGVYEAQKSQGEEDRAWLKRAYTYAVRDHALWINDPHLAGDPNLSRYFDFGEGPAPESLKDETDHYQKVAEYFLQHPELGNRLLVDNKQGTPNKDAAGPRYSLQLCDIPMTMARTHCEPVKELSLSREYFKGDRSMRESGFDISFRFSPFGADTHHFAPVCLNSLLYKSEKDLESMATMLGLTQEAEQWKKQAAARQKEIVQKMWDAQLGEFFDFNFMDKKRSTYEYASMFYPLWAGMATKEQAAAVVKNLPHLEKPGGLLTSPYETGAQWDSPYAWAPLEFIAVEGLRRYGYNQQADRLSYEFLSTVAENFHHDGTIREKYNAITRSTEAAVTAGYSINVVGFGWTNAAFLEFLHQLPNLEVDRLAAEQLQPVK
ncbi:MAG TPA: trehalase family glycosidase [Candidatus Acidoferrum sp.]|jgi:alpha,alpha-trehalase